MNKSELAQVADYFRLLSQVESSVASYYSVCHGYWPDEELLENIALEEKQHSEAVLGMLAAIEADPENFTVLKPLVAKPLELFIAGLRANEAKVRSGVYKKVNALAVARDLENSLIEAGYDKLLRTSDPVYNMALEGLLADNRRHRDDFATRLATLGIVR